MLITNHVIKMCLQCNVGLTGFPNITARRPGFVVVDKDKKTCQLIDIACPGDKRVKEKEDEKFFKYQDLARELRKIWNMEVKVIPIVIGVLGTIPARLKDNLKEIVIPVKASQSEKSVLLGTARILRKVLEASGGYLL